MTYVVAADANGNETRAKCAHLDAISEHHGELERACVDCLAEGTTWLHLRQCLSCGQVRCCDSSPRQHASRHASLREPIARSIEPGEQWAWCYLDELILVPQE